jgi:Type II CAAX prenyl endopeptidase Rce1-like
MNLLILIGFGAAGLLLMWCAQTLALLAVGDPRPVAWLFRHDSESEVVRWAVKLALQAALLSLLLLFPLCVGENPFHYLAIRLAPPDWTAVLRAVAATLLTFTLLLAVTVGGGWVRLTTLYRWPTACRKVARACLTPVPLAFIEEGVFRGVVLEQLLQTLPDGLAGRGLAVGLSALLFSAVHFLRPQKRILLPAVSLYAFGWTLGMAYLAGGCTLWLPVAVHAAGVLFIQTTRPFVDYRGPTWLIGSRSYPICGVLGMAVMALLTTWIVS